MVREFTYTLGKDEIKITTGLMAKQAGGSCTVQSGDTVVLVTATASDEPRPGIDFFPLTCDFEEKQYSAGKIPGGFIKREGRPTDKAILTARLMDRPLRPLFPDGYRNDVQVIATVLSMDEDYPADILAMIGSSVALSISNIPFQGPTGAVNIGYINEEFVINPSRNELEKSDLDLTVAGTKDAIMMVEAGANIVSEEIMLKGILRAHEDIIDLCEFISEIQDEIGKEKQEFIPEERDEEFFSELKDFILEDLKIALDEPNRALRREKTKAVIKKAEEKFISEEEENKDRENTLKSFMTELEAKEIRRKILEENKRPDHRSPDEIRDLTSQISLLPRTHGSGLFTRGETQVLSVTTLGAPSEAQMLDGIVEEEDKRFMHHYNFPPYSVGESRPLRGPGRREIGHGALGERAILPVIPEEDQFPYTIRVVSEVLESNGSSSQAAVCGTTLSLMDAGVPIKAPVAGIAMGLIEEDGKAVVLTDIQGIEDFLGDMDFKVAGTREGITALQMDIKAQGVDPSILEEALKKSVDARNKLLDHMETTIDKTKELSPFAPRIERIQVDPEKIRDIIGPGGKVINKIIDETGVQIDTEDDGNITVTGENQSSAEKAIEMIERIVEEPEVGKSYLGTVTKIMNFGAFVEILPGKEGLVHISNIAHERIDKVEDVLQVGDEVLVKLEEIDKQDRLNLSRKALLPREKKD